jgi:hypothetical protein
MADARTPFPEFTPEQIRVIREKAARFFRPMPEEDDLTYWKHATLEEKGRILADLLDLVDAIGNYGPVREPFRWSPQVQRRVGHRGP